MSDPRADLYFAVVPEWVLDSVGPRALQVYAVLRRYADDTGRAWPARSTLAKRCGASTKTIDRALAELVAAGCLQVNPRFTDEGDRTSNDYRLVASRGGDTNVPTPSDIHGPTPATPMSQEPEPTEPDPDRTTCGNVMTPTATPCQIPDPCWVHNPDAWKPPEFTSTTQPYVYKLDGRRRDLLWEAIAFTVGSWPETRSEAGRVSKAVKELREIGAKPTDVVARGVEYRRRWPGIDLTPQGLTGNWSRLESAQRGPVGQLLDRIEQERKAQ